MIEYLRSHPVALWLLVGAVVLGIGATVVGISISGNRGDALPDAGAGSSPSVSPTFEPEPVETATPSPQACPEATTVVSTAEALAGALASAAPGDVIALTPGVYTGEFVATTSGTPGNLITLCGTQDSVLDGDGLDGGYVMHLDHASYWHLVGFAVTNGQKGVMADATTGSIIEGLTVTSIGDEGIHLRGGSTDNVVRGNTVSHTGLRKEKFGEGIYIGTAESNWCDITACEPDRSDRNVIEGNTIFATSAESVDIKEGTTGGVVRGNSFEGSSITGGDSWVDVKGNGWLIDANSGQNSPMDGFQTHEILDGWGTQNVFSNNFAAVNGPGFGFSLTPERDNVVACSNTASNAGEGLTNVSCSP